jgi:hypothetical protein
MERKGSLAKAQRTRRQEDKVEFIKVREGRVQILSAGTQRAPKEDRPVDGMAGVFDA